MSVAIRKIDGVASVAVSLNEGLADIELEPGNAVDPERIRQVVRDNGFTPKTAEVSVTGRLTERGGRPALSVTGPDIVYVLAEPLDARGGLEELKGIATGADVIVTGRLPETPAEEPRDRSRTLQLYEWKAVRR